MPAATRMLGTTGRGPAVRVAGALAGLAGTVPTVGRWGRVGERAAGGTEGERGGHAEGDQEPSHVLLLCYSGAPPLAPPYTIEGSSRNDQATPAAIHRSISAPSAAYPTSGVHDAILSRSRWW